MNRLSSVVRRSYKAHHAMRHFSGLGSPMFPQRPQPDIDAILDKTSPNDKAKDSTPDFLSKHGGKVALAAFAVAGFLIYSYFKGGRNKTKVEEDVLKFSNVDPYEMHELRYLNELNLAQFNQISAKCKHHFSTGFASYSEFVAFLKSDTCLKGTKLKSTHLLDRFMQGFLTQTLDTRYLAEFGAEMRGVIDVAERKRRYFADPNVNSTVSYQDTAVSIDLLLTVLNMCMLEDAAQRIEALFNLAATQDKSDEAAVPAGGENDEVTGVIGSESVEKIVQMLIETDQIPPEKQTMPTGVKYPFKLYKRRGAKEMIEVYQKESKVLEKPALSLLEFQTLLLSSQVCVWAECYRGKQN